jgi:hypothetical protein
VRQPGGETSRSERRSLLQLTGQGETWPSASVLAARVSPAGELLGVPAGSASATQIEQKDPEDPGPDDSRRAIAYSLKR